MTARRTAIIILIGAIICVLVLLILSFLFPPLGLLVVPVIWFMIIMEAGLISLRALAWAFVLMGVLCIFFFFASPFVLGSLGGTLGAQLVIFSLIFSLICAGINFAFGLLTAIISFFKKKKTLTTEEEERHNQIRIVL